MVMIASWNNVAAKWAVRQLIQQQTVFNSLVVKMLAELHDRNDTDSQEIGLLFAELLNLQQQHEAFATQTTEQLNDLRQQLAHVENLLIQHAAGEKER